MSILVSDVLSYARIAADREDTTDITDANMIVLLKGVYQRVRRKLANKIPQLYTKRSEWTATGDTQDVTGAPLSLTDFGKIRRIRLKTGSNPNTYVPVGVANEANPQAIPYGYTYVYLRRGNVLEFYPDGQITGNVFELSYLSQPININAAGNSIDCPDGYDEVLGEYLASKLRNKYEESQTHLALALAAERDLLWDLSNVYGVNPEGPSGDYDE